MLIEEHWTTRAACRGLPLDWWTTGHDGNRLALLFCRACPVRTDCAQLPNGVPHAHQHTGVIRAGIAYSHGSINQPPQPLPTCRGRTAIAKTLRINHAVLRQMLTDVEAEADELGRAS